VFKYLGFDGVLFYIRMKCTRKSTPQNGFEEFSLNIHLFTVSLPSCC